MVKAASKAQAVGMGHSWWKEPFCAAEGAEGLNVVTTELAELRSALPIAQIGGSFENPLGEGVAYAPAFPATYPIWADEEERTVTVAAGVSQRTVLDYLATFQGPRNLNRGRGWTLPGFSWFIDQTIGGAVATGTHGSSLQHGSLSANVVEYRLLKADGTYEDVTEESNPHLMRALRVNVGRLGVITQVKMRIIPQQAIRRTLENLDFDAFVDRLQGIQDAYNAAVAADDPTRVQKALEPLQDTQLQWHSPLGNVWWADYEYLSEVEANSMVGGFAGPGGSNFANISSVYDQAPFRGTPPNAMMATVQSSQFWANWFMNVIRGNFRSGVYSNRRAYASLSDDQNRLHVINPYDQYELAIPLETMGECFSKFGKLVYDERLFAGARTPFLIRFVKGDDGYLSNVNGGHRVYINMEDFVQYSTGRRNVPFQRMIAFLREEPACAGRLHWGKAGWPEHAKCFDGNAEYPDTWCDFGCAAEQVDPTEKFSSIADFWVFNAQKGEVSHDLLTEAGWNACCTKDGFKHGECQCVSRPDCG